MQLLGSLRELPGLPGPSGSDPSGKFVEQYLTGEMRREYVLYITEFSYREAHYLFRLTCDEAPDEPASVAIEKVLKIECNITINTNYMLSGIMDVSKTLVAPSSYRWTHIDRPWTEKSRRTRLPWIVKLFTAPNLGYPVYPHI